MNLRINTDSLQSRKVRNLSETIADIISYAVSDSDLGKVLVARSSAGICAILLGDAAEALRIDLAKRFSRSTLFESETAVMHDLAKVLRYIAKPSQGLDLTLDMRGTPFQRCVWEVLMTIPVGRTVSYMELARRIRAPAHAQAVAGACAANPIALAIPCHRVVRSNGDPAGYRWGIDRKRELIRNEAIT